MGGSRAAEQERIAITVDVAPAEAVAPGRPPDTGDAAGDGGYREVLGIRAFAWLWVSQVSTQLGESVALVAMPLLVYDLTDSAELLGAIFVVQLLPRVVLAPLAGMVADRLDRRRIMLIANLARAGLVALLPFTASAPAIAVIAMVVAVGTALSDPAEMAAVPAVVPPGLLVPALSASQVATSVVRVGGPALAAGVIAMFGPGPAFWVQALCFVFAAGCVWRLALPPVFREATATRLGVAVRREIADGLRVVRHNPVVRGITAVEILWQLVFAALVVGMLVYVKETLRLGAQAASVFSLLTATFAGGTAIGALAARGVGRRIGRPWLMAIGYLAPLMLIPAGFTPPLPVLFVCLFVLGFTDAWAVIAMQTYLAEAVPDALRGRVYATWLGAVTLASAVAFGLIGWLTPRFGPPITLAAVGALVGIGGPLLLLATGCISALRRDRAEALTP